MQCTTPKTTDFVKYIFIGHIVILNTTLSTMINKCNIILICLPNLSLLRPLRNDNNFNRQLDGYF